MAPNGPNTGILMQQLESSGVRAETGEHFYPDMSIINIMTLPAIEATIREINCTADERIGLAERIYHEGKKVFAALILHGKENYILKFRDHGFLDSSLPLTNQDARMAAGGVGNVFADVYQWEVLPVSFRSKMWENHQEFGWNTILPLLDETEYVGEGGYGEVTKVKILPSQQAFYPQTSQQVQVIRKRLKSKEVTKSLENEKIFLRLLNQLHHPNIIPLLGSYTHRGEHHFLFQCIDMDLERFFNQQDQFGRFKWDFTFYSALRGLSSALSNAHTLRLNQKTHGVDFEAIGYHHDIRPANILVSQSTFILTDFGLGNLKPADATSATPFKLGKGDYLAPECREKEDLTRAVDVWAFGCLIADTATYMLRGSQGVKEFSDKRLLPSRRKNWRVAKFHGKDGEVKNEVKEWLKALPCADLHESLIPSLVNITLPALTKDPQKRPKIDDLCNSLTLLSVRAHYIFVLGDFAKYIKSASDKTLHAAASNNMWFQQQRFQAWGRSLALNTASMPTELREVLTGIHDESVKFMAELCYKFEFELKNMGKAEINNNTNVQYAFENEVDQLVERLWDCLPANLHRVATDYWHQAILCTTDTTDVVQVEYMLRRRYGVHSVIHAMTVMRRMRLDILKPDSLQEAGEVCRIPRREIELDPKEEGIHRFGKYNGNKVLVEWTRHPPAQGKFSLEQRELVINLKAQCMNHVSKPKGLRTLECIGFVENQDRGEGYGLVYQFPDGHGTVPSTLLRLLKSQEKKPDEQPPLGDKFKLALALADFLKEFHTIGWLHENFNPHNIIFFRHPDDNGSNDPFVVGLQKSRPDGDFWQTEGVDPESLHDYLHPDYVVQKKRYRPTFDYYSLGIVLLEIGLWRPLNSWKSKFSNLNLPEVRSELIGICQARLGVKMGVVYRDVVLQCMDGSLETGAKVSEFAGEGNPVSENQAAELGSFTEKVVEPLRKIAAASI